MRPHRFAGATVSSTNATRSVRTCTIVRCRGSRRQSQGKAPGCKPRRKGLASSFLARRSRFTRSRPRIAEVPPTRAPSSNTCERSCADDRYGSPKRRDVPNPDISGLLDWLRAPERQRASGVYARAMPHILVHERPGSNRIRAIPVRNAFGGQVIGSTARLRRLTLGNGSPLKTMR
jgi:hypothetical protein